MTVAETISEKVLHLPLSEQRNVLEMVKRIEIDHQNRAADAVVDKPTRHILELLAEIRIDGPPDLADRHDFYAHGKLED